MLLSNVSRSQDHMLTIPFKDIKDEIDSTSSIRHGNLRKLFPGEMAIFDTATDVLLSRGDGSEVFSPPTCVNTKTGAFREGRFVVDTFIIDKKYIIPLTDLTPKKFGVFSKVSKDFAAHEVSEVMKRMRNVEDIAFAPNEDVKRVQKFFDNLGKKVVVFANGAVLDLGPEFTLIVQSDIQYMVNTLPSNEIEVIMWESVGFFCELPLLTKC